MTITATSSPPDEPVTDKVLRRAVDRGQQGRQPELRASSVQYLDDSQSLRFGFSDLSAVVLPINHWPELANLSRTERHQLVLGMAGSALCLDAHDLHVSIAGLVAASAPLMEMATALVVSRNGSRSSARKSVAGHENVQKGGRPRKALAAG